MKLFSVIQLYHSNKESDYSMWVTDDGLHFDDMIDNKIPLDAVDELIAALNELKELEIYKNRPRKIQHNTKK